MADKPSRPEHYGHLAFRSTWQVLGPFQIGTREVSWGADPLEFLGGFRALQYDQEASFRTSLRTNGTTKWALVQASEVTCTSNVAKASLSILYPDVDWDFLKSIYGWAAVQYQAWARGEISVAGNHSQSVVLYADGIFEYWIDDVHYFGGDLYTFRRAPPVLHLTPGSHKIDVRLVRDVRAMGGMLEPSIDVSLELRLTTGSLELARPGILMAEVVDGKLASSAASVTIRNVAEHDVEVVDIRASDGDPELIHEAGYQAMLPQDPATLSPSHKHYSFLKPAQSAFILVAGQTRPVAFNASLPLYYSASLHVTIVFKTVGQEKLEFLPVSQNVTRRSLHEPHRITYFHPAGIVSYSILRAPANVGQCSYSSKSSVPVLLQLHGAGVEADSDQVRHALDAVDDLCAWVLFPTGVTSWSGDDWHNWGFADVEQAVKSIPLWIETVGWQGPGAHTERWVVSGHSNGGQGTWYALTHRPDRVVAAIPVSGYTSIQKYVPYELWQPMDPRKAAVISGSLNSYRHEMLLENADGIPVLQQHGEKDDNVPTYHSRFLGQLLSQAGTDSTYYELPGKGHYYEGIMVTAQLKDFYHNQTASNRTGGGDLKNFSFVVADPGDMGPKGGIRVKQLEDPGQYGKVTVTYKTLMEAYYITTSNVLSLELEDRFWHTRVEVDGQEVNVQRHAVREGSIIIQHTSEGVWEMAHVDQDEAEILHRRGRQLGTMTAILRTQSPFTIRHGGNQTAHIARQVSRNLHQYFAADARIMPSTSAGGGSGNVISIHVGQAVPPSAHPDFPLQIEAGAVTLRDSKGRKRTYGEDARTSAAFLRPLDDERLELVIWGSDSLSLAQAARLIPLITGVGQPDFVVLGESARWRGVEGALAMGFFDHVWHVTPSSVV